MPVTQRIVADGDTIVNTWEQPERGLILDGNKAIINDRRARRLKDNWAAPHFRIPQLDLELLKQRLPDLASPDGPTRRKAWLRFFSDPASAPYRVRVKAGGATNRSYLGGRQ